MLWALTILDPKYGYTTAEACGRSAEAAKRAYLRQPWTEDVQILCAVRKVVRI